MNGDSPDRDPHELAVLADWAEEMEDLIPNPEWKKAYGLIRRGTDLLLRRRARSTCTQEIPGKRRTKQCQEG